MRFLMFYHSLRSDWNHGNAHFLRGIATELLARGHEVRIYEPRDSWSAVSLLAEQGREPFRRFRECYPRLKSLRYALPDLDLHQHLDGADVVIVHEWNDHALVKKIGDHHRTNRSYRLYFHDTHHRMVTSPDSMAAYDLSHYDGVLAYGKVLQELYRSSGRVNRAWTWHEAADVRVFRPHKGLDQAGDLVWIGNWGDGERTAELKEFLIEPAETLKLRAKVYGVRYPDEAKHILAGAGIEYRGWLANFDVPKVFGSYKVTVHVPRRPYVSALPGIPTIRPFEALACGIPLVTSPWEDCEELFRPNHDFLVARDGHQMRSHLRTLLNEPQLRSEIAANGLRTILSRHTCGHRVNQLLAIDAEFQNTLTFPARDASLLEPANQTT